jgi:nucleotide-binding universal stress UspA family protein
MTSRPAVVVGVDGSPQSLFALDWATQEAIARPCTLRIVHAFRWPLTSGLADTAAFGPSAADLQRAAQRILSIAADRASESTSDLDVRTDLPACTATVALIDASRAAALVVVGHRGLGGLTGLLVGSVGVQTAAHAACPVVVVRPSDLNSSAYAPGTAIGQVVVGVDGSELSSLALDFAYAHASRHGLGVIAINVLEAPPMLAAPHQERLRAGDTARRSEQQTHVLDQALAGFAIRTPTCLCARSSATAGRPRSWSPNRQGPRSPSWDPAAEAALPACSSARPVRTYCTTRPARSRSSARDPELDPERAEHTSKGRRS